MRKRTVNHIADTVFWYALYFLPVIAFFLYLIAEPSSSTVAVDFEAFFEGIGLGIVTDNVIITTLKDIFGQSGLVPIFSTNTPFIIFTWFIGVYIMHLCVDFVLFIPRIAHKWLKKFTNGEE